MNIYQYIKLGQIFLEVPEALSYIVLLKDWEILPKNLKLLDKKLGEGQFGIVMQGLLTTGEGDSVVVAVKTVKGIFKILLILTLLEKITWNGFRFFRIIVNIPHYGKCLQNLFTVGKFIPLLLNLANL